MTPPAETTRTAAVPVMVAISLGSGDTSPHWTAPVTGDTCAWTSNESLVAVLRSSSLKSPWSRFDVSRPTTSAKTTRMISVRVAETAARRQRTGQRFGVSAQASRSSLFIPGRPDHVTGTALGVQDPGLALGFELSAQIGDEHVDRVRHRHRVGAPNLLQQGLARDHQALVAHQ